MCRLICQNKSIMRVDEDRLGPDYRELHKQSTQKVTMKWTRRLKNSKKLSRSIRNLECRHRFKSLSLQIPQSHRRLRMGISPHARCLFIQMLKMMKKSPLHQKSRISKTICTLSIPLFENQHLPLKETFNRAPSLISDPVFRVEQKAGHDNYNFRLIIENIL